MQSQENKSGRALSVLVVSTLAFTVCFMVWMMFAVIGIPLKKQLGLNATEFGLLTATPVLTGSLVRVPLGIWIWATFWVSRAFSMSSHTEAAEGREVKITMAKTRIDATATAGTARIQAAFREIERAAFPQEVAASSGERPQSSAICRSRRLSNERGTFGTS